MRNYSEYYSESEKLYIHCPIIWQIHIHCPIIGRLDLQCKIIRQLYIHCPTIGQLDKCCPTITVRLPDSWTSSVQPFGSLTHTDHSIRIGQLKMHCPIIQQLDKQCPTIGQLDLHCPIIGQLNIQFLFFCFNSQTLEQNIAQYYLFGWILPYFRNLYCPT